jgi:signal transduction histidine kinase
MTAAATLPEAMTPTEPSATGVMADLVSHATWVSANTPTSEVVRVFDRAAHVDSRAVLGEGRVGLVARGRFFARIGHRFGYALFENRPIAQLAEEGSTVDAQADPVEVVGLVLQREADRIWDDVVVLDEGRFVGLVSIRSLLVHHKGLLSASLAESAALDARNRDLEELSRLQSEFVAHMTHELRSPLNTMLGLAALLKADDLVADRHGRNLELLMSRGRELLEVIDNILDLSRMQARALQPWIEPVDVPALLEEGIRNTEVLLGDKPVRVQLRVRGVSRCFPSDPTYLRRILTNLLSNAAGFTEVGHITLAAEGTPGALTIQVSDTGIGISPEDLPRLFHRFTQLESPRTRRRGGSGLGLAIVRGLLDQLGGHVHVSSRLGEGTTFTVEVPAGSAGGGKSHAQRSA